MGSSLNKDSNISLYVSLAKRVYMAGETVEGVVHIDCKADRPYRLLHIRLEGNENVHWEEQYGKSRVHYNNNRETYKEEFVLAKFDLGIRQGQYSFPFSLLLPASLTGTLHIDGENFIHYTISAYLPAYDENSATQTFDRHLHIREPPRNNG